MTFDREVALATAIIAPVHTLRSVLSSPRGELWLSRRLVCQPEQRQQSRAAFASVQFKHFNAFKARCQCWRAFFSCCKLLLSFFHAHVIAAAYRYESRKVLLVDTDWPPAGELPVIA